MIPARVTFSLETILAAARSGDWQTVYGQCVRVLDEADTPDAILMECCDKLPEDLGDVLFQIARDAAGDMVADDSEEVDGILKVIETSYTLFAIPIMVLPGTNPSEEEFDVLAACLKAVTGDIVHIVPEIVTAEDFVAASPDALRYAVGAIDFNRSAGHDLDPLEHIVDRTRTEKLRPRISAVILGARIESFPGGTEFIPSNWVGDAPDGAREKLADLLRKHESVLEAADWPMAVGGVLPTLNSRLRLEEVVNAIATIGNELEVLPDVLIYEDPRKEQTFVALSVEGRTLSDSVIDRRGSIMGTGDLAGMLRTFIPDLKETRDATEYTRLVTAAETIN